MQRLVIPAGQSPSDVSPIVDDLGEPMTWQEVADVNGQLPIEQLGSEWCEANGVDGLGILEERPEPVAPPAEGLEARVATFKEALADASSLAQVRAAAELL